jgi:hypothetical protein
VVHKVLLNQVLLEMEVVDEAKKAFANCQAKKEKFASSGK